MRRSRLVFLAAAAVFVPTLLSAQSLTGGDEESVSFSSPSAGDIQTSGSGMEFESVAARPPEVVPEPASFILTATGAMVTLVVYNRRRRR